MTPAKNPRHNSLVPQHLFIVDREQPDLFSYLAREFSAEPDVTVMLDRRQGERRMSRRQMAPSDRRQTDRRSKAEIAAQLSTLGYAFVRLS
ncbi:MAG TPA: hypothetical protein VN646_16035 [Candidatus Acidoferrum sp.]|nr:hypothetical protein [Candidatus Acidoferrum sp.]